MEDNIVIDYMNGLVRRVSFDEITVDCFASYWPCFYTGAKGMKSGTLDPVVASFDGPGDLTDLEGDRDFFAEPDEYGDHPMLYDDAGVRALTEDMQEFGTKWAELNDNKVPQWGMHTESFPWNSYSDWIDRGHKFEGQDLPEDDDPETFGSWIHSDVNDIEPYRGDE